MKTALKTTLIVVAALAGSITLAAAQQAGGSTNGGNGGNGGHGGNGGSGRDLSAPLNNFSSARPCTAGKNCRPQRPRIVKTRTEGECSCTYTRYTDADGYYYKKICIRFDGTTGRRLRCAL